MNLNPGEDQPDSGNQEVRRCPLCDISTCDHLQSLRELGSILQNDESLCPRKGHTDRDGTPLELKFFCKACWMPICADCSIGKHKSTDHHNHTTDDIHDLGREFLGNAFTILRDRIEMLENKLEQDFCEAESWKRQLKSQTENATRELEISKREAMQQVEQVFLKAEETVSARDKKIKTDYIKDIRNISMWKYFLSHMSETLKFNINTEPSDARFYVQAFKLFREVLELLQSLETGYQQYQRAAKQLLVLPDVKFMTQQLNVLPVGTEHRKLQLAFSFKLAVNHRSSKSIVVTDLDHCLLSVKRSREETSYDNIVHYFKNHGQDAHHEYDVDKGRYFLSQLKTGEIVASYSGRNSKGSMQQQVLYFNGDLPRIDRLTFELVYGFQFEPYGIATTSDNTIILCVNADEQVLPIKGEVQEKGLMGVLSMSLRGKILNSTILQPSEKLLRPDYIAVNTNGEICISDSAAGGIVIMNSDLTIKERLQYPLPTYISSLQDEQFSPHGTCYDGYGRIIVADPDNNTVVRLVRHPDSGQYVMEPLLSLDVVKGFQKPNLVAMGADSTQLWVVCIENIFVFDYSTQILAGS